MRSQAVQHVVLALVVLTTVLWMDLVTAEMLRRAALFTLVWVGASTLLVASAAACIALIRTRHRHQRKG
ncbi:hypothetical protein [Roseicella aquatilis]|uniref:Uncharacterized protein n=1 Tax=Roseicella aquatilis TaxID=2527868 RepID=A0A4R4D582_9PROT|nr:hypothetical protein [Roseicella aquatilis]TCZ55246.1 hypothetical protein EXY23_21930 [Roseicella aquatilis]